MKHINSTFINRINLAKGSAALALLLATTVPAFAAPVDPFIDSVLRNPNVHRDISDVQINRDYDSFEKSRTKRELEEGRNQRNTQIEDKQSQKDENQAAEVKFVLKHVQVNESKVLQQTEINAITEKYVGQEVTLKDLFALTDEINALYAQKGYLTCKAYLPAQRIHEGSIEIRLYEGTVGNVAVVGNKSTATKYITNRVGLKNGEVANLNKVSDDLLFFNATNDAQLQLTIQAGQEPGTSDFVIKTREPQRTVLTALVDNAGNYSTGEWREGLFWSDRSLTGRRDALTIGYLRSKGTDSVSGNYSTPLGHSGTKLNIGYSTNSVESQKGMSKSMGVKGHAYAATIGIKQPILVNSTTREEVTLDYAHQKSTTDIRFFDMKVIDDTLNGVKIGFAHTDFGKSHIFYHKHSYDVGSIENISNDKQDYNIYTLYALYQKAYQHGQELSGRLDVQKSFTDNLRSQRQYYIGGTYSVRGYKENLLYGDSGVTASLEYSVPVFNNRTNAFIFTDYGTVENSAGLPNATLWSAGLGIKSRITKNISASLMLGIPIIDDIDKSLNNNEKVKSGRLHFTLNGTF